MQYRKSSSMSMSAATEDSRGSKVAAQRQLDPALKFSELALVLLDFSSILSMVLGGCCANVWTYEQLLMMNPGIGSALTFSQMVFITTQSLPFFLHLPRDHGKKRSILPRLKPRQVPLSQWALQVIVLTTGSLLNNWAFAFNVPLAVMIVFRSAGMSSGLAISMLLGFVVLKRRYTVVQISVLLVSVGVVLATLSKSSGSRSKAEVSSDMKRYSIGIGMLVLSLLLTGILGIFQEKTYKKYGPCWKEGVFYTHCLSLPVFLFLIPDVKQGLTSLSENKSSALYSWIMLGGNLVTQLICVSGVNRLTSRVSSVSTNLVLTTRKAMSLCISVWWFGGWNTRLAVGACMVFSGSLLFSVGNQAKRPEETEDKKKL
ncbi:UAA transporter [Marasmius fiardii PR-910]|nr:UAA transporter [Marasmius fiardii PR-910]